MFQSFFRNIVDLVFTIKNCPKFALGTFSHEEAPVACLELKTPNTPRRIAIQVSYGLVAKPSHGSGEATRASIELQILARAFHQLQRRDALLPQNDRTHS